MPEQRPIWRGFLRLALVSCPVALYSAHHAAAELHFHFINPKTGNRVRMVTLDAGSDAELRRSDLVKGYEFKKDTYVLLDDNDFERAKVESSEVLTLERFVPADSIAPVYYDDSYYMLPDGKAGADVFAVLREAIGKSRRIAMSRLVMARRERSVALMPLGRGLVLHTLHDPKEINDPEALFAELAKPKLDADLVKLAVQLVARQAAEFRSEDMEDRYQARLREVIEAKLRGEEVEAPEEESDRGNVVDLMSALKRSLGAEEKLLTKAKDDVAPKKRPAAKRAPAKRRA